MHSRKLAISLLTISVLLWIFACSSENGIQRDTDSNDVTENKNFPDVDSQQILAEAESLPQLRSLIIGDPDSIYHQWYVNGATAGQPHNMKSASKSVMSALYGIALKEGWIESLNSPVVDFLPEYFDESMPEKKREITLEDLLTMRSGLESTSFNNYGRWIASRDWIGYQIRADLEYEPGTLMRYSTGSSHLLGVILTRVTGQSLHQLAQNYIFDHFGNQLRPWDRDPQGYFLGGNNMRFEPESLFKFGQIYANDGKTQSGETLFSTEWIDRTFEIYGHSNYNNHGYGYHWWIDEYRGYETRFAWGHGGQYLFWVPELDLIAVTTSTNNPNHTSRGHRRQIFSLLEDKIIPYYLGRET